MRLALLTPGFSASEDDPCILARCTCEPYRTILINRSMLASGDVVCDDCHQVFVPVE